MNRRIHEFLKVSGITLMGMVTGIFLLLIISLLALVIASPGKPTPVVDEHGRKVVGSISEMEEIELGGVRQWIITRGHNSENPVLLYIHGGPGSPEFPFYRQYATDLERDFIVVHWEQRGAGKSYSKHLTETDLTIEKFVTDIAELSTLLKARYGKEKVYLLGHSWGSTIAALAAHTYPEHFFAYIGMGQEVNLYDGTLMANTMLLACAEKHHDEDMKRGVQALPDPPYDSDIEWTRFKWTVRCRGDVYYEGTNMLKELLKAFLTLQEYTLSDKLHWFAGADFSPGILEPQAIKIDLRKEAQEFDVPVYILQGEHDIQCPAELVKEYFAMLKAPKKALFLFAESAHTPLFEEREKAIEIIRMIAHENGVDSYDKKLYSYCLNG